MSPLTLVFDLDGTLVDSAPDLMTTLNVILAREGIPPLPVKKAAGLLGAGARALLERGFSEGGHMVDPKRMDTLYRDFLDHYAEHLADKTCLFDGAREAIDTLDKQGHILAICTNKVTWHSTKLLEALGIARRFKAICGRDAFPYFKPDARHLIMAVDAAGGQLDRAIMIGDSRTDVETARNAGKPSICVDFGYSNVPIFDLKPTRVISHFDQLIQAIHAIAEHFDPKHRA